MNDVTETSHPALYNALDKISHDMGHGAGWTSYPIPDNWWPYVGLFEVALNTLSPEDFQTFCVGDNREMAVIASRSEELLLCAMALDCFAAEVEYWPHPYMVAG